MTQIFRHLPVLSRTAFVLTLLSVTLRSESVKAKDEPVRLVWFMGSVTQLIDDRAAVDLGEAHSLRSGDILAVFRAHDDHFEPVGTLTIDSCAPTWSLMLKSSRFEPKHGDVVIYIRSLHQLGTGEDFMDSFLRHQFAGRTNRNGYSNLHRAEEAATLQRFSTRQPRWVKEHKDIAGVIRSASVSPGALAELQPLLTQILKFQEFQSQGVPVEKAVGAEWSLVLSTFVLRSIEDPRSEAVAVNPEVSPDTPESVESVQDTAKIPIDAIRRKIDKVLFTRSPEERRVATLICIALEQFAPKHEKLWISQQLRSTQFASLAEDAQLLFEFESVMAQVRAEMQ